MDQSSTGIVVRTSRCDKKRVLYPVLLVVLVITLAVGLSAAASAATMTLVPSGPAVTSLLVRNAASNWEACADGVNNTMVYDSDGWTFDLYQFPDVSATATGTISNVRVRIYVRAVDVVDQNSARAYLQVNGTNYTQGFQVPVDQTWDWRGVSYAQSPDVADLTPEWQWADIDALLAGVGLRDADSSAATSESRCTRVELVITYNNAPVAVTDSFSVNEDDTLVVAAADGVLDNDTDADADTLAVAAAYVGTFATTQGGSVTMAADGSFTYTAPAANWNGSDTFTYMANDGTVDSAAATVTITVNAVNDEPSFTKGADQTVDEDCGPQTVVGWATAVSPGGGADEASQTLAFHTSVDNHALFSDHPSVNPLTGTLTYTPAANASGSATVTIYLTDDGGSANGGDPVSPDQTFTITVNPVNDAPVAVADPSSGVFGTLEDMPLLVVVPGVLVNDTDVDGDALQAILVTDASHGSVALNANGSFVYTPDAGYYGADSFTYRAYDGALYSNTVTVSLEVIALWIITPDAGLHGWISPDMPVQVVDGTNFTFNFYPSAGYHVADVLVDGVSVGAVNSYTFVNVSADHTIEVKFALNWGTSIWGRPGLRR